MARLPRLKHGQYYPRGRGVENYERHYWVENPCRNHSRLVQELVAAAKGPKIEIPLAEIRRKGLISALRDRARRR